MSAWRSCTWASTERQVFECLAAGTWAGVPGGRGADVPGAGAGCGVGAARHGAPPGPARLRAPRPGARGPLRCSRHGPLHNSHHSLRSFTSNKCNESVVEACCAAAHTAALLGTSAGPALGAPHAGLGAAQSIRGVRWQAAEKSSARVMRAVGAARPSSRRSRVMRAAGAGKPSRRESPRRASLSASSAPATDNVARPGVPAVANLWTRRGAQDCGRRRSTPRELTHCTCSNAANAVSSMSCAMRPQAEHRRLPEPLGEGRGHRAAAAGTPGRAAPES